jgi:ketosteroid isomerase-like protein
MNARSVSLLPFSTTLLLSLSLATPERAVGQNRTPDLAELTRQVLAAEGSFAESMKARSFERFASHIAPDAIFFGGQGAQRGKEAVLAAWRPFFDGPNAPFAWQPETVEVLATGALALSTGPVLDPNGNRVGTFNSIWRREADGRWLVVFDKGS